MTARTDRIDEPPEPARPRRSTLRRIAPILALVIAAAGAIWAFGDYLSFQALEENYEALIAWRDQNIWVAGASFMALYALSVALSVPGAIWLTILAGFLFGAIAGTAMVVIAATLGATAVFLIAKSSLGVVMREKAGRWIARLEDEFRAGEISFLLVMRLVPAVPFFVANLVPAFLGASTFNFVWTTLAGIVPGTLVFISIGAGLGEQLARGEAPDLGVIFEPHVLGPLLGLALLAMLPHLIKRLRRKPGA